MLIQFIIVKKVRLIEYFEYLIKQIKDPIVPIIPLNIKLLDNKWFAKPKTKKWEWNKFRASEVLTIIESFIMPKLSGRTFKSPGGIWSQGMVNLSIKDNLHSSGQRRIFKTYRDNNEITKNEKNFNLFLLLKWVITRSKGNIFIKPRIAIVIELRNILPFL